MLKEPLIKEYVQKYAAYQKKAQQVAECHNTDSGLSGEVAELQRTLQTHTKAELDKLGVDRLRCQKRVEELEQAIADHAGGVATSADQTTITKMQQQRNAQHQSIMNDFITTSRRIQQKCAEEHGALEHNTAVALHEIEQNKAIMSTHQGFSTKFQTDKLPEDIVNWLKQDVAAVVAHSGIEAGADVVELCRKTKRLDDVTAFAPKWLSAFWKIVLPVLMIPGTWLILKIADMPLDFVAVATNAIAKLLLLGLAAATSGFITYFLIYKFAGLLKPACIAIGVAVAAVCAFFAYQIPVAVPYGLIYVLQLLAVAVICLAIGGAVWLLLNKTPLARSLVALCMKLPPLRKAALPKQAQYLHENQNCYFALLHYRELLDVLLTVAKQRCTTSAGLAIAELEADKKSKLDNLHGWHDSELEAISKQKQLSFHEENKRYVEQQQRLIEEQGQYILQLKRLEETIRNIDKKHEDLMAKADADARIKANNSNAKVESMRKALVENAEALKELAARIYSSDTVKFEESQGILSDSLYIADERQQDLIDFQTLQHDKKPIVFLYALEDTANIAALLERFIREVVTGFYVINAKESFEMVITDPVAKARKFEALAVKNILTIENDIGALSKKVAAAMQKVSQKGMSIDDYNCLMAEEHEDWVKFFKYIVAHFIVPEEEAAQNTDFFNSDLWGTLGDGHEHGFLPIFYINRLDWESANEDRPSSAFIRKLRNAIGKANQNIYTINVESLSIHKI